MLKRQFDIVVSLTGLTLLSPVFVIMAFLITLDGGPAFYRGERIGKNGKAFEIYKFRTMIPNAEKIGGSSTAADDVRITRVGKFLRTYKLDELPQLINVLKGEMSFVGPRPQVAWAVALYTQEQRELLSVRPGITDFASIKFNNEGDLLKGSADPDKDYLERIAPEKLRLGLEYVKNRSLWLDIRLIFGTLKAVFAK
jgi:lipopolysaccharide/colanic/teichoic acid biosynthesis glycosyltransferase